jgi:glycosyltransferase involved in cell wall biosynthesis
MKTNSPTWFNLQDKGIFNPSDNLKEDLKNVLENDSNVESWKNISNYLFTNNAIFASCLASLRVLAYEPGNHKHYTRIINAGGLFFLMAENPISNNMSSETLKTVLNIKENKVFCFPDSKKLKISIIMPTFNRGYNAKESIISILKQDYTNFELLLLNDGGNKKIEGLVKELKDPRIRYYYLPRSGLADILNAGLILAEGDYICYLDDDDIWYADHISCLLKSFMKLKKKNCAVYSKSYLITGKIIANQFVKERLFYQNHFSFSKEKIHTSNLLSVLNIIHSKSDALKAGGFNNGLIIGMDWDLWARMSNFVTFHHVDLFTGEYRIHGKNMTQKNVNWARLHQGPYMVEWLRSGRGLLYFLKASFLQHDVINIIKCYKKISPSHIFSANSISNLMKTNIFRCSLIELKIYFDILLKLYLINKKRFIKALLNVIFKTNF